MREILKIGIIGGSGLSKSKIELKSFTLETPYGKPSSAYELQEIDNKNIFFLRRHGEGHTIPPHKVNYRANIFGFKELKVERIFGVFAVGSLNENIPPGSIVIPNQIIDFTQGMRENTFFDGPKVVHIDFTNPFCEELRTLIFKSAEKMGISLFTEGTYICINGPRLETSAEIKFYKNIGADIIGMTLMPEAALAREAEICYVALTVVANYAAGISKSKLTVKEVVETMNEKVEHIRKLIKETLSILPQERYCSCKDALKDASF